MLKMAIFFKLIVEIKKKTYICYVFMYMYVKIASKCQVASELKVIAIVL